MILGITFKKLLLIDFWFTAQVGSLSRELLFAVLGVLLVGFVISLALNVSAHTQSKTLSQRRTLVKWYRLIATLVIIGELLVLFRQYSVYVLGARFFWLILAASLVVWGYRIIQYSKQQRQLVEQSRAKESYSKYLPK